MFHDLALKLQHQIDLTNVGLAVSHRRSVADFQKSNPGNQLDKFQILAEWEITNDYQNTQVDYELLDHYQKILNIPNFWDAIISDRRLMQNIRATYFQDYRSPYTHTELLQILQTALIRVEKFFNSVQPKVVISFICVTLTEYLIHLFAKSRGIQILNIRTTRIKDFMVFSDDIQEPSNRIQKQYEDFRTTPIEKELTEQAEAIYKDLVKGIFQYEGVGIKVTRRIHTIILKNFIRIIKSPKVIKILFQEFSIKFGRLRDRHDPGLIKPMFHNCLYKPLLKQLIKINLRNRYVNAAELSSHNFAFFPLHLEPEVALLVYGRYNTNQIEVIRNIASSLPTGMELLVKDHPKSIGRRTLSYYTKILEIPNCKLIDPNVPTDPIINHSKLVLTIGGSAGWEAIIKRKPVVIFGNTAYQFLPSSMVIKIRSFHDLSESIQNILYNYQYNKKSVIRYLASIISQSQSLNFYSTLLNRDGVAKGSEQHGNERKEWNDQITLLAEYTRKCITNA